MTRNRMSSRKAGTTFERSIADHLAQHVDDRIDRRVKTGAKDRGDIGGLRVFGHRVVIEAKNVVKMSLGTWWAEAVIECGNDDALAALVIHKRHGKGQPGEQWVTTTLDDFIALVTGSRPSLTHEAAVAASSVNNPEASDVLSVLGQVTT